MNDGKDREGAVYEVPARTEGELGEGGFGLKSDPHWGAAEDKGGSRAPTERMTFSGVVPRDCVPGPVPAVLQTADGCCTLHEFGGVEFKRLRSVQVASVHEVSGVGPVAPRWGAMLI